MRAVIDILRWIGTALGVLLLAALVGFGLIQTSAGRAWLERLVVAAASSRDLRVSIEGLRGIVPFRFSVARIALADRAGTYATLRGVGLDIAAGALLTGRAQIRALTVGEFDFARLPLAGRPAKPLADYLRLPHLPIPVALDRLSVSRLVLGAPLLGQQVVATLAGHAAIANGRAETALDVRRIDGQPGNLTLRMTFAGATPQLSLHLSAIEPSGLLADRLLRRHDHLPLALALDGSGPLADWHGRLAVTAGAHADIEARLRFAMRRETTFGLSGIAAVSPLLPRQLAPILGDQVRFALRAQKTGDRLVLDRLAIMAADGRLTGKGSLAGALINAKLSLEVPRLSELAGLLGEAVHGSAAVVTTIAGNERRPHFEASLSGTRIGLAGYAAGRTTADLSATPNGTLDNPKTRIAIAAKGRIERLDVPARLALGPRLGRNIDWSLAASTAPDAGTIDLSRFAVNGAGLSLTASGDLARSGQVITGRASLSVADLRPFSDLVGRPVAGSVILEGNAGRRGAAGIEAAFKGDAEDLRTGIPAADALLGGRIALTGILRRDPAGIWVLDKLAVAGADAKLSAGGHFDPASRRLAATVDAEVPRLQPLGVALGGTLAGAVAAQASIEGPFDRLQGSGRIEGSAIAAGRMRLDRLRLDAQVADLARPRATIDGSFRAARLEGTLALAAETNGSSELSIPRLRLAAANGNLNGELQIGLDSGLVRGSIKGRIPDLARWSHLAGIPIGGDVAFAAGFSAQAGQTVDLTMTGTGLAVGGGASAVTVGHLDLAARLADLYRAASGSGRLSLSVVGFHGGRFAAARLRFDSLRPGRFAFAGDAAGRPLTVALAGDAGIEPGGAGLRLTRLAGSLGGDKFMLEQPLILARRGYDFVLSGLSLAFGPGRLTGSASLRGQSVALNFTAAQLPLAPGARLLGHPGVQGALSLSATVGGSLVAPRGHLAAQIHGFGLAAPVGVTPPRLGLALTGDWNGRSLALDGRVTGLTGDQIAFGGTVPLLLRTRPFGLSVPPDGRLALRLQGSGEIGHLADLLPIGEDRLSGKFAADLALDGTVASPNASGRVTLAKGRYENFASGATLTKLNATLSGDRNQLALTSFSASDGASGKISGRGGIALGSASGGAAAGPTANLMANLHDFRVAARDDAVVTASGNIAVTGPLTAPDVKAGLTIDRADVNLPTSLPPNVVVIHVVRIDSKTGKPVPPPTKAAPSALPAVLDIVVDMPRQVFVRGHGLDSEWRGRLKITGSSAAPQIAGTLHAIRGTFDILGKTFRVTRGQIAFDGSSKIDPSLDIAAEVAASDITAQITVGGLASAPKITLSSTPALPQDEILARVLFNQSTSQITAAQGLALAQAAATLTSGGPGIIDRLRSNLGLDWLRLGQAGAGPSSGVVNPNPYPNANNSSSTNGTAISAGKYIANGISIGVTQGVSPPTSQVTVEVQLGHHLTLDTSAGQNGGTGVGLSYNYDY
jgi:translocation and assembly module TamB